MVPLEPMVPDLAGWRAERMPTLPETAFFELAPDWVCEVLSRSTEAVDRNEKLPLYAACGVKHVWLVDPIERTLEVYVLGDAPHSAASAARRWREVRTYSDNARLRAAPFDAIELELEALWSGPRLPNA